MHLNKNINIWQKSLYSLFLTSFVIFSFVLPVLTFAQPQAEVEGDLTEGVNGVEGDLTDDNTDSANPVNTKLINPIGTNDLNGFIKHVLEGAIKIGIPVVAIAIIYSGFLYVTAMGNEEKLKTAHKAILYTLIGAVLLIGSWAIATLISDTVLSL